MRKTVKEYLKSLVSEVKSNPLLYLFLTAVLLVAHILRVYRLNELLLFAFDQERDALVIWRFWHKGDLFLAGPTTGIEGILRGPWYYWLIAPFYLLGGGDPVWAAIFLALTSTLAILLLFKLAGQIGGLAAGVLALIIASFSFDIVFASRWLSNPTPMLLISVLLLWSMFQILERKTWYWVVIAFLLGMAMQFGSAAEVFYFPAVAIFAVWQRDKLPEKKLWFISASVFLLTFIPQIVFDFIHDGVLSKAVKRFLFEQESFSTSFFDVFRQRLNFYYELIFQKFFPDARQYWWPFLIVFVFAFLLHAKEFLKDKRFVTLLIISAAPLVGMLFFQGNYGIIYHYYFTGYYLIFILFFAVVFARLYQKPLGKLLLVVFLLLFLWKNGSLLHKHLTTGIGGPIHITLGNQLQAVDWILEDAKGREFNTDVYVPPVISYSYDYLFLWRATQRCGEDLCGMKLEEQTPLLYTLYEVDVTHPQRLEAWLERQEGIGGIEEEARYGGITVQRRQRLE